MPGVRLSVKAIIVRDGRLLVLKCRDDAGIWYALPGGGQEAGRPWIKPCAGSALRSSVVECEWVR